MHPVLWLDVEDLFWYARNFSRPSGIQRLSFELYAALAARGGDQVRFLRGGPHGTREIVSWAEVRAAYERLTLGTRVSDRAGGQSTPSWIRSAPAQWVKHRLPPEALPAAARAVHSQAAVFRELGVVASTLKKQIAKVRTAGGGADSVSADTSGDFLRHAQPGDVFVALGAPWASPDSELVLQKTKRLGLRFALLIYDLIPVMRPEFCVTGLEHHFDQFLRSHLPVADFIFAISKAAADDVAAYAAREKLPLVTEPRPISIGTEIGKVVPGELPEGLEPQHYVLFVSTIEARKNHQLAFRAWQRLLATMSPNQVPTLVFAGRTGWRVFDLLQQIEATRFLGGKLRIISEPSDAVIAALYANARFTIFPSLCEGWGLPVSESLAMGKLCIASYKAPMTEAGGDFCLYHDPENVREATQTYQWAIQNPDKVAERERKIAAEWRPVPWTVAANQILQALGSDDPTRRDENTRRHSQVEVATS